MSYTAENWRSAITKLLQMTSGNQIKWEVGNLFIGDSWTHVDQSLMAKSNNKIYVISKTRSKYFLDEEEFVWEGGFNFSIFESDGYGEYKKIATSPSLNSLSDLYDAAENNLAFNRNALGDLLG